MGFKIFPAIDTLRNRNPFNMKLQNKALAVDVAREPQDDFFDYKQGFYFFNNTAKQFPAFHFDEEEPEMKEESEYFCLHMYDAEVPKGEEKLKLESIEEQAACKNSPDSTKFKWGKTDPTTGLSFKLWKKEITTVGNCTDKNTCAK